MTAFNLFDLYHPGGLPRHESERHQHGRDCACGCGLRKDLKAEDLGFKNTPALLEIKRLDAMKRKATPKATKPSNPWKGATRLAGTVKLADLDGGECTDLECTAEHTVVFEEGLAKKYHTVERPANVFTLSNGATARVRTDRKFKA